MDELWVEVDNIEDLKVINDNKVKSSDKKIALRVEKSFLDDVKKKSIGNVSYSFCFLADYALKTILFENLFLEVQRTKSGVVVFNVRELRTEDKYNIKTKCERSKTSSSSIRTTLWTYDGFVERMKDFNEQYYTITTIGLAKFGLQLLEKSGKTLLVKNGWRGINGC